MYNKIEMQVEVLYPWGQLFDQAVDQVVEQFDLVAFSHKSFQVLDAEVHFFSIIARDQLEAIACKDTLIRMAKDINNLDNEKKIRCYLKGVSM